MISHSISIYRNQSVNHRIIKIIYTLYTISNPIDFRVTLFFLCIHPCYLLYAYHHAG